MSKLIRFIGDVHGKYEGYKRLIKDFPRSIQVGDMGVGFKNWHGEIKGNPPHYAMVAGDHRFIRGNHDNPEECAKHSQWIPDGHVEGNMMFCGGAVSIDRAYRTEGYSWWKDEELSTEELNRIVDKYSTVKPRIMVTHDCPETVAEQVLNSIVVLGKPSSGYTKLDPQHASRTRQAFHNMWIMHSPEIWIFGHWHVLFDHVLRGTRFICLPELGHIDLEI